MFSTTLMLVALLQPSASLTPPASRGLTAESARRVLLRTRLSEAPPSESLRAELQAKRSKALVKKYGGAALLYAGVMPILSRREFYFQEDAKPRAPVQRLAMSSDSGMSSEADAAAQPEAAPSAPPAAEPSATEIAAALFRVPEVPESKRGPTMPVSSTADKIKGFAAIGVALVAIGFGLNYAFSEESVFLADPEPVNEGLRKYAGVVESADL